MRENRLQLRLVHLNDTHSHFDPSDLVLNPPGAQQHHSISISCGGYARISQFSKAQRTLAKEQQQEFLLLHAGDSFQGSLYFNCFKGEANATLLNALGIDAMTLGNHEFDLDHQLLAEFIQQAKFEVLASNIEFRADDPLYSCYTEGKLKCHQGGELSQQLMLKELNGHKLAIIGVTTEQTPDIACPEPGTLFHSVQQTTQDLIDRLRQSGIVNIIVLSHLGIEQDRQLARSVDGLSLIIGGHTHTLQGDFSALGLVTDGPYGEIINQVPILHAGKHAESLGLAEIEFDEQGQARLLHGATYFLLGPEPKLICDTPLSCEQYKKLEQTIFSHPQLVCVEDDPEVAGIITRRYQPALHELSRAIVCDVEAPLRHSRLPSDTLPHGSEIAPLVTQSLLEFARLESHPVHFAIHNAGGVRTSLPAGDLTRADILGRLLPFAIPLVIYQLRGQELRELLESAINNALDNGVIGTGSGSFPYVANLRYHYQVEAPAGERITLLEHRNDDGLWREVIAGHKYRAVSSAYTASGKEGYDLLGQHCPTSQIHLSTTLGEAFEQYARNQKVLRRPREPLVSIKESSSSRVA
ncbi:bifunctional metallophosphatase/5'-nucleotidase [Dongshaea marina]|uniref:bifunctional metallophosphatase/5'-nucleotidase n=1 Tax=Dongshaea marina TaxID=2047966 RepID=UPI000D3E7CE4|nr:bifunctional metallophosphatase/5'-nucleotidase [Dongshaea marina]